MDEAPMPRALLGKARHRTQVVHVPGNDDRPLCDHDGLVLGIVATGDWVESCSALVEDFAGRLSILRWTEAHAVLA